MLHHYLLTRFNLPLWQSDKTDKAIDRAQWLAGRMKLFETYCIPSVSSQTSKDFTWIILFDKNTPEEVKARFRSYKDKCSQIVCIFVNPEAAWHFCEVFIQVIKRHLEKTGYDECDTVLTTYLDNDDALNIHFVEDVQRQAEQLSSVTVINYDNGCQYFSQYDVLADVDYRNNHFLTVKESISRNSPLFGIRTCYGYGSHAFIEKKHVAKVLHVRTDAPMWLEVVHEGNVINDVNIKFRPKVRRNDPDALKREYGVNVQVNNKNILKFYLHEISFTARKIIGVLKRPRT